MNSSGHLDTKTRNPSRRTIAFRYGGASGSKTGKRMWEMPCGWIRNLLPIFLRDRKAKASLNLGGKDAHKIVFLASSCKLLQTLVVGSDRALSGYYVHRPSEQVDVCIALSALWCGFPSPSPPPKEWDDLPTVELWDGCGIGGSQKGELAFLKKMLGLDYVPSVQSVQSNLKEVTPSWILHVFSNSKVLACSPNRFTSD